MHPSPAAPAPVLHDALISAAIFFVCLALFHIAPFNYVGDSKYTLLVTENLLSKHSFMLDDYVSVPADGIATPRHPLNGDQYQLEKSRDGHTYYYLPVGSSVLTAPFVLVGDLFGKSIVRPNGEYDVVQEEKNQLFIASLLMAGLAVVFYHTGRLLLPPGWSASVALGAALGTQIWSTATRSLGSQTWDSFLLGCAIYLLLAQETGRRRAHPVWLATILSWAYFARPTSSIVILAITIYLLLCHWRSFPPYALTGALWAGGFAWYSVYHFGTVVPSYYITGRLQTDAFQEALVGNLISPSRGLFLYVPAVLFVLYLIVRFWRYRSHTRLVGLSFAVCLVHLLVIAGFQHWWGGYGFGSRLTTELIPWLTLLTILGLVAARRRRETLYFPRQVRGWKTTLATGAALGLLGTWINARGACVVSTQLWNIQPISIDQSPWRLWDWRYPQALAGLVDYPPPEIFPRLPMSGKLLFASDNDEVRKFLLDGWSTVEQNRVWSDDHQASLIFATDDLQASTLRLRFWVFLALPLERRQRVVIRLNGQRLANLMIRTEDHLEYPLAIPPGTLREKNFLTFSLPDAVPASSVAEIQDPRVLGISLQSMQLDHSAPPSSPR